MPSLSPFFTQFLDFLAHGAKVLIKEQVRKVLTPMKPPVEGVQVEPLVCFWDAMHPTGETDVLFSIPLDSGKFTRVWVFSMSAHLRNFQNTITTFPYTPHPAQTLPSVATCPIPLAFQIW